MNEKNLMNDKIVAGKLKGVSFQGCCLRKILGSPSGS